ncbi:flavin containing amine oxidase, putative [Talaromyces stipitatus ATCC 10500]|uniref:Flavin containing amine oxidase, putative n=1 Tax=Talaromyces stipitatus (strain ATCC 10500 / CBS 375.48 / QM 6759 / NRRL 1006) TaxID=441959 RepID=B8LZL1_TALSN|nr:flavin containing amine oxidase, putative [Talaromyces stipitatus ATCC 10500]EED22434.1 flavin containing amine oxidase, putative [Talaromyces stipitatus ATCC 10500]
MECKANQLAQLASWFQYSSSQRHKSTLHPAAVGRKLPLSARKYQIALMGKTPHVGIIGAGISGLRCADILAQNGAKVTILEARDRIGGRITQVEVGGNLVDLGANWIHGTEGNPIDQISRISNTTTCEWDGRETIYDTTGKLLDEATTRKLAEWMWTTVDEGFEFSTKNKDSIPASMSLYDFCCKQLEQTNFTAEEKAACKEFSKFWGAYVGEPVERQSMKFFCLEECIEGTNLFVASTYKNILEHISKSALKHTDLHLNSPVVQIQAANRETNTDRHITVVTEAGKKYHFDDVIVTCPLGWLKKNKSVFSPSLPLRLSSAIDNISYGRLEKIYVTFPHAFWHIPTERKSISGTGIKVANGPDFVADSDNDKYPPAFTQWLEPKYVEAPSKEGSWNMQCVSLAALPPNCAHPTLLFYIYGPCSAYVVNNIKDMDESSTEYYNFLDNFVKPFYSSLPGYSGSSESCNPTAFRASRWISDDYAGNGSYANFQVGLETGDKDIEAMRLGMGPDRGVWFAGEHTAPFVGLGTTTGAYWSGERAAGQICDLYSLGQLGLGVRKDDSLPTGTPGVMTGNTMFHKGNTTALRATTVLATVEGQ